MHYCTVKLTLRSSGGDLALKLEDNPSYLNFPGDGHTVNYAEGIYVGYRYYDKKKMPVGLPLAIG